MLRIEKLNKSFRAIQLLPALNYIFCVRFFYASISKQLSAYILYSTLVAIHFL